MEHYFARLQNAVRLYWEKPAVCNYRGESFTYGQLATQIERFHIFFEACGLKKGDRIAICAKNTARMAVSFCLSIPMRLSWCRFFQTSLLKV